MSVRTSPARTARLADGAPLRIACFAHVLDDRAITDVMLAVAAAWVRDGSADPTIVVTTSERVAPPDLTVVDLGGNGRRTSLMVPALARVLRRLAPDLVIAHGNGASRAAILAARGMGRGRPPVIAVEHNHYSTAPRSYPRVRRIVDRVVLPRADALAGVSPGVAADLAATFPVAASRTVVLPTPLPRWGRIQELAAEPVRHPWFDGGEPLVTTVGNLNARKDQGTLIRAIARARAGGLAARLAIIGREDDPAHAAGLRRLVEEHGVADAVAFLGGQENPLRFVARSSAFALSSRNEGLGIALLEAMACGVPAVSTDCPSGPDWVLDGGRAGVLVPVGDDAAMADALARVLTTPRLRADLTAAASERVRAFAPRRIAQEYVRLARALLAGEPVTGGEAS